MADADQPFRENVDQESSQKLICGNRQDLLLTARGAVFPAKRDLDHSGKQRAGGWRWRRDVYIAPDSSEQGSGPPKGGLTQATQFSRKRSRRNAWDRRGSPILESELKLDLVLLEELLKSGCELAAEGTAECTDGQKESAGRSDPSENHRE